MRKSLVLIALALSACGTSPEPAFYELSAVTGTALPGVAEKVQIDRPTLAAYLDRPQIVREKDGRLDIDEMNRWAAPLDEMTERLLAEDLRQRLSDSLVTTEDDQIPALACRTVETSIQKFNRVDDRYTLQAQLVINDKCGCNTSRGMATQFSQTIDGTNGTKAMSALLGDYAESAAISLQAEARLAPACRPPASPAPGK